MELRNIPLDLVRNIIESPGDIDDVYENRKAYRALI